MPRHGQNGPSTNVIPPSDGRWWLENVLIETTLMQTEDGGGRTLTEPAAVRIEDGVFSGVRMGERAPIGDLEVVDGAGLLLLPSLRDTHVHLDKTFYGGPWRAPTRSRPWPDRLKEEEKLLPEMSDEIPTRSNAILDLLVSHGTTRLVAHCNVDHVIGTRNVERVLDVLHKRDDVDWDVVAYPQHGLQRGRIKPLLAKALESGATMVGGLDPGSVEHDVDGVLETVFDLAARYDVGVDLHLHDSGTLGLYEMDRLSDVALRAGWEGRVSLSCAAALACGDPARVRATAAHLAEAGICVGTTMSVGGSAIPVAMLDDIGVQVSLGSDSIMDILTPFGQGDILEQLWVLAQRFQCYDEVSLARTLHFGAGDRARWSAAGTRTWPTQGEAADFMLIGASCSAEAIARRAPRHAVFHQGRTAYIR